MGTNLQEDAVSVRAMAALLDHLAPAKLNALRNRFPESIDLFKTDMVMGGRDRPEGHASNAPIRALIDDTIMVLDPAIHRAQLALTSRIISARQYRLVGAIVAAICSAGAVVAMGRAMAPVGIIVSTIAVLGSIAVLVGEHLEKPVVGGAKSASELLVGTIKADTDLRDVKLELLTADLNRKETLQKIARKVCQIAASVKEIGIFGGVSMHA